MKVLSIKNPASYLLALGIKPVENRSWKTNFRGKLLIHSSGADIIGGFALTDFPPPIAEKFQRLVNEKDIIKQGKMQKEFLKDKEFDVAHCYLTSDWTLSKQEIKEFEKNNGFKPVLKASAIIGEATLVDIVTDSNSSWAIAGKYHWIFENPIIYEKPINNIKGKLRIWDFEK